MDVAVTRIELPRPVRAAASDGSTVWCAADDGVRAYTPSGRLLERGEAVRRSPAAGGGAVPRSTAAGGQAVSRSPAAGGEAVPELHSLAAVPGTVAGTGAVPGTLAETVLVPRAFAGPPASGPLPDGTLAGASRDHVHWLGPSGTVIADAPFTGRVVAGGGAIWAVGDGVARRLAGPGTLGEPLKLPALDACAVEGERLWWTSQRDDVLRGGPKEVRLGRRSRGAMTVCAGSLWISVTGGLLRVSAWSGEPGRFVRAPEGPVRFLVCANGVLLGGGRDVFAPARAAGAALRVIELGLDAPPALMIAAGRHVWVFPEGAPAALIVTPG
ncbi:hypothetical protein [Nonomuraea gerenzanensis]|uniref:Uncharacterized protein n=1 Tax=Nonomuraea gerenzanensis TaxID=93944 RepID=A0A1M4E9X8_9ACTN|nr:hypothetical protein [Nonomuraea gerenzanensis]UBU17635.1 hypothetical protein LCN96_22195 [Nonomuraea gerenzanensis]SBO95403.1 hypothetical protein BN4615_P4919 [Nonomuraea gerenzanensis]